MNEYHRAGSAKVITTAFSCVQLVKFNDWIWVVLVYWLWAVNPKLLEEGTMYVLQ